MWQTKVELQAGGSLRLTPKHVFEIAVRHTHTHTPLLLSGTVRSHASHTHTSSPPEPSVRSLPLLLFLSLPSNTLPKDTLTSFLMPFLYDQRSKGKDYDAVTLCFPTLNYSRQWHEPKEGFDFK